MSTNDRPLSLGSERLSELTPDDLNDVVAGQAAATFLECVDTVLTDVCTHAHSCGFCTPTFPVNDCLSVDCLAGR